MTAIGVFLLFGAAMALLAGVTLVVPGTVLDRVWALNPHAYDQLAPFGKIVGALFLLLAAALVVASTGWFQRRKWGWQLTVAIIASQVLGDLVNLLRGQFVQGSVGVAVAGSLFMYLTRPHVRSVFWTNPKRIVHL